MSTTIAELLIKMGVSVEGAKAAEGEIKGVSDAAQDTDKKGGAGIRNFGATAGKALAAVGVAALAAGAAIFKLVDSVTSAADEVVKGSKAAALGTEAYQRLSFAAKISGTDIKAISIASKTAARGLNDAATKGTGPMVEGLELVGLRIEDVIDLPFEKQLGVFADAISGLDTESEKLAASQLLLGSRSGPQLATLLAEGSAGIEALGDEAARTGGVLGGDALAASAEFQDSITRMKTVIGGVVNTVGIELIPVVEDIINQIKDWALANGSLMAQDIKRFIKQSIPVIKALASVVSTVVGSIGDFIGMLGGAENALAIVTSGLIGFKVASLAASGPLGLIAGAFSTILPLALKLGDALGDILIDLMNLQAAERDIRQRKETTRGAPRKVGDIADPAARARAEALVRKQTAIREELNTPGESRRGKSEDEQIAIGKRNHERRKKLGADFDRAASELDAVFAANPAMEAEEAPMVLGPEPPPPGSGSGKGRRSGRRKGKARKAAALAAEPESSVTLAESLLAIRTGTADPKQLKQVIQQLSRKTPSSKSIKPTVAIDFFNFVITQNIKGANPTQIAKESAMAIRGEFEKQTAKAGQTVPTGIAR